MINSSILYHWSKSLAEMSDWSEKSLTTVLRKAMVATLTRREAIAAFKAPIPEIEGVPGYEKISVDLPAEEVTPFLKYLAFSCPDQLRAGVNKASKLFEAGEISNGGKYLLELAQSLLSLNVSNGETTLVHPKNRRQCCAAVFSSLVVASMKSMDPEKLKSKADLSLVSTDFRDMIQVSVACPLKDGKANHLETVEKLFDQVVELYLFSGAQVCEGALVEFQLLKKLVHDSPYFPGMVPLTLSRLVERKLREKARQAEVDPDDQRLDTVFESFPRHTYSENYPFFPSEMKKPKLPLCESKLEEILRDVDGLKPNSEAGRRFIKTYLLGANLCGLTRSFYYLSVARTPGDLIAEGFENYRNCGMITHHNFESDNRTSVVRNIAALLPEGLRIEAAIHLDQDEMSPEAAAAKSIEFYKLYGENKFSSYAKSASSKIDWLYLVQFIEAQNKIIEEQNLGDIPLHIHLHNTTGDKLAVLLLATMVAGNRKVIVDVCASRSIQNGFNGQVDTLDMVQALKGTPWELSLDDDFEAKYRKYSDSISRIWKAMPGNQGFEIYTETRYALDRGGDAGGFLGNFIREMVPDILSMLKDHRKKQGGTQEDYSSELFDQNGMYTQFGIQVGNKYLQIIAQLTEQHNLYQNHIQFVTPRVNQIGATARKIFTYLFKDRLIEFKDEEGFVYSGLLASLANLLDSYNSGEVLERLKPGAKLYIEKLLHDIDPMAELVDVNGNLNFLLAFHSRLQVEEFLERRLIWVQDEEWHTEKDMDRSRVRESIELLFKQYKLPIDSELLEQAIPDSGKICLKTFKQSMDYLYVLGETLGKKFDYVNLAILRVARTLQLNGDLFKLFSGELNREALIKTMPDGANLWYLDPDERRELVDPENNLSHSQLWLRCTFVKDNAGENAVTAWRNNIAEWNKTNGFHDLVLKNLKQMGADPALETSVVEPVSASSDEDQSPPGFDGPLIRPTIQPFGDVPIADS